VRLVVLVVMQGFLAVLEELAVHLRLLQKQHEWRRMFLKLHNS
jgi:hypothetical protein